MKRSPGVSQSPGPHQQTAGAEPGGLPDCFMRNAIPSRAIPSAAILGLELLRHLLRSAQRFSGSGPTLSCRPGQAGESALRSDTLEKEPLLS
jgi:hypothetical protein